MNPITRHCPLMWKYWDLQKNVYENKTYTRDQSRSWIQCCWSILCTDYLVRSLMTFIDFNLLYYYFNFGNSGTLLFVYWGSFSVPFSEFCQWQRSFHIYFRYLSPVPGVSILSSISKLFESIVNLELIWESPKFVLPNQNGFVARRSCVSGFNHKWCRSLYGQRRSSWHKYFKKAFDKVPIALLNLDTPLPPSYQRC